MFHKFTQCLSITFLLLATAVTHADTGAEGVWQTGTGDIGYLHVAIEPCEQNLCGTIMMAFDPEDTANPDFEHIGKQMIWDMSTTSDTNWGSGKIWDPIGGKTYKSKMAVDGDILSVSGCFFFFCRAQKWTRVASN